MTFVKNGLRVISFLFIFTACAPVKFTKSNNIIASTTCEGANCNATAINCAPRINTDLTTFTYASLTSDYPSVSANCSPADVDYSWVVKKADATTLNTSIPGLVGSNPTQVNFTILGSGNYYLYLTATKNSSGLSAFNATTPLEFIVPGTNIGNSLTCDPKLNANQTSIILNASDSNPSINANCNPAAATYVWTVTKDGSSFVMSGLSGASSTPNIKSYGVGVYRISLYATATGSTHWQSTNPLTVTVQEDPAPTPNLDCNPRINGSLESLTLTSTSSHPLITANCAPSDNTVYQWSVTKNGSLVSVSGLSGANSNPNFLTLGSGTYLIYLQALKTGYNSWSTSHPLTITVDSGGSSPTISCAPRLNGSAVAVTVTPQDSNPSVSSNCSPNTGLSYQWVVTKNDVIVSVGGLAGATSTPNFIAAGAGTYFITLNATASGYNSYSSPSALQVTVAAQVNPVRQVVYDHLVQNSENKVDILMVVDDSNSMAPENTQLAQKLQGFVNDLTNAGIDWQMCSTVTRSQDVYNNGTYYWGASRNWVNYLGSPSWILKTGAADPYSIFTSTVAAIGAGWAGTDDERGIKAAWWSFDYEEYNNCYRDDASLAVILISDEDERSVGGNASLQHYSGEYKALENDDLPASLVNKVKLEFGNNKRFTFNSIIVKPNDSVCMSNQDAGGAKSHYGHKYHELSQMTGGASTSICDSNYSNNLYYFKDRIINSMASVSLECAPVGEISVSITPSMGNVSTTISNNNLVFNPAIPAGRNVHITYDCPMN